MKRYEMILHVDARQLGAVIEVIRANAEIVRVSQIDETPLERGTVARYAGGKKNKGISAPALMLEILAGGKVKTREELVAGFVGRGFSANSVSPTLSILIKKRKVEKLSPDTFSLRRKAVKS